VFATNDHDKHRVRRAAISPFFSKSSVRRLQSVIDERLDKLLGRFVDYQEKGAPMTISYAFGAFTSGKVLKFDNLIRTSR
jgi:cytochrome P450